MCFIICLKEKEKKFLGSVIYKKKKLSSSSNLLQNMRLLMNLFEHVHLATSNTQYVLGYMSCKLKYLGFVPASGKLFMP